MNRKDIIKIIRVPGELVQKVRLFGLPTLLFFILLYLFTPQILHSSEIFSIQAGAFSSKKNAHNLVKAFEKHGIQCTIHEKRGFYKVYCGEFSQKSDAFALKKKMSSMGFEVLVVSLPAHTSQSSITVGSAKQSHHQVTPPFNEKTDRKFQEPSQEEVTRPVETKDMPVPEEMVIKPKEKRDTEGVMVAGETAEKTEDKKKIPARSQDSTGGSQKIVLNLNQCIKKAIEVSPEISESRYEEEVYKSKKLQADSAIYPQIEILAMTGPSPRARGDQVYSPDDVSKPTINGIFGSADVTLIQPLYTFGKISSYKEAALSGTKVAKAGVDKKTSDIILRTKELYYSLLLARDIKNIILEIKDELVESIKKAERQIEVGSPWADELNLAKLRAFLGEVERNLNEAEKSEALAKDALLTSIGLPRGTEFDIAESSLIPEDRMPEDLRYYLKNAVELRPEFIQLKEGLNAKNALLNAEKSSFYPQLFVGLKGSIAGASNRSTIENPFIYDYFNHAYGAVFLGLKWSIDFGITEGKVKEAQAEYHKLVEKKRFADEAIPLQVRKAYLDLDEARKSIPEMEMAYKNARKWLVAAIANFDLGIGEAKEIADAVVAYAQMKVNYLRTIYNHRMSFANLSYATGVDIKEVK